MTAFGRAQSGAGQWSVDVAVRSVNHRYLEIGVRLGEDSVELESRLRKLVAENISRGKVDIMLRLKRADEPAREVRVNEQLLQALLARIEELSSRFPIAGKIEIRDLLALPGLLCVESPKGSSEGAEATVLETAQLAIGRLVSMRETEGSLLAADLRTRLAFLEERLSRISAAAPEVVLRLHKALRERLDALFPGASFEAGRLEQEAALLAERSDITEEFTRLGSHLRQFGDLLSGEGPVGRKLDFLTQEIQREVNTLGSKCRDLSVARDVIDMKTETEKIREQVQNLE
jgi:uncharacterized protein (TIGR00255 family)